MRALQIRIRTVATIAVIGGAGASVTAIVAMAFSLLDMTSFVRPNLGTPIAVGFSDLSTQGRFWIWSRVVGRGCESVVAGIYPQTDFDQRSKGVAPEIVASQPPSWSFVSEHVVPPIVEDATDVLFSVSDTAFGAPFRCLSYRLEALKRTPIPESQKQLEQSVGLTPDSSGLQIVPAITKGAWWPSVLSMEWNWHTGYVPTHILWPGFLLNTLFWSVVIASPFWLRRGFVAWRSARRRRAGLCPLCGYARGGINPQHPCPECGKSVPPAPQSTPSNAHTP
jgi:hypothetical protein